LLYTYDTQTHGRKNPNASSATPQRPFFSSFQPTFHPCAHQNKKPLFSHLFLHVTTKLASNQTKPPFSHYHAKNTKKNAFVLCTESQKHRATLFI